MSGILISGSDNVDTEGKATVRLGDIGLGACGHTTVVVTSSRTVEVNNRGVARVGDMVAGDIVGVIVTGASRSEAGN